MGCGLGLGSCLGLFAVASERGRLLNQVGTSFVVFLSMSPTLCINQAGNRIFYSLAPGVIVWLTGKDPRYHLQF